MTTPIAVYIHIPFCPSKCGYCDFNSYGMGADGKKGLAKDLVEKTVEAIKTEVSRSPYAGLPSKTIFFGGGTPTFLEANSLCDILDSVRKVHPSIKDAEITSEANPGTVDSQKFKSMRERGFNRLSIGVQSFDNEELLRLGRVHNNCEAEAAYDAARRAGFENINLDLMFALPRQIPALWRKNLKRAISLDPDHLSLYCLTIEPGTAFKKQRDQGKLPLPNDDIQTQMYDLARDITKAAGYEHYEISNFAKPGKACEHNLAYWRGEIYAGYGPGAVGCMPCMSSSQLGRLERIMKLRHPLAYSEAVESGKSLVAESEVLGDYELKMERIMLGLRLSEGLLLDSLEIADKAIEKVVCRGWARLDSNRLILTREGQNFCSEAILMLID